MATTSKRQRARRSGTNAQNSLPSLREGLRPLRKNDAFVGSYAISRARAVHALGESQATEPGGTITWIINGAPTSTCALRLERVAGLSGHSHFDGPTGTVSPNPVLL